MAEADEEVTLQERAIVFGNRVVVNRVNGQLIRVETDVCRCLKRPQENASSAIMTKRDSEPNPHVLLQVDGSVRRDTIKNRLSGLWMKPLQYNAEVVKL